MYQTHTTNITKAVVFHYKVQLLIITCVIVIYIKYLISNLNSSQNTYTILE